MKLEDTRRIIAEAMQIAWKPAPLQSIGDWARENVTLPRSDNARYGGAKFDTKHVPHVEVIFDFLQDWESDRIEGGVGEWRELVVIKPSQGGISTAAFVAMAWMVENRPGPLLYVTDTRENMKEMVKQRIDPLLRSAADSVSDELDDRNQTTLVKRVNGSMLRFAGAQGASGLISFPASWVFIDEAETHEILPQGSTIELGVARAKADDEHKIVIFSKPQDEPRYVRSEETGRATFQLRAGTICYDRYLSGTQERMHVPCPKCGEFQELEWKNVKFEHCRTSKPDDPPRYDMARVIAETFIECVKCGKKITEDDKRKMVRKFKLVPKAQRDHSDIYPQAFPGRRSIQFSDLYNVSSDAVAMGRLAAKWIEAQGDEEKSNAFYNDHLGLPRPRRRVTGIEFESARKLCSPYKRINIGAPNQKPCPIDPYFIGMAVDCQQACFKWCIAAFASTAPDYADNGEMWVLDWGQAGDYDTLAKVADTHVTQLDGTPNAVFGALIDSRYRPHDQYEFCWNHPSRKFRPAMGEETTIQAASLVRARPVQWKPNQQIEVAHFASQSFETELYDRRISRFNAGKYAAEGEHRHPRIHLPEDVDDAFLREITNCTLTQVEVRKGFHKEMWKKKFEHLPNDWGDTLKMLLVLWMLEGREVVRNEVAK